jgi:hypothetical protein
MKNEKCKLEIANLTIGQRSSSFRTRWAQSFSRYRGRLQRQNCVVKPENNLQISFVKFHSSIPFASSSWLLAFGSVLLALCFSTPAQTVADKTVATVTNGSRATPDLITYSDLVWQLTLEPGTPFSAKPSSEQLNKALRTVEDQLLILEEARKLPPANTPEAIQSFEDQVKQKRDQLVQAVGSRAIFENRMKTVGLTAEQLDTILRDRVTIENYLDFRFRAFVLPPNTKEVSDRYQQEYGRLRNSGRIVPALEEVRGQIERNLTEEKIESEIDRFVDNLREQLGTEIVVLNPV